MANINLSVVRGDTLLLRFRFRNSVTNLPIDITDWQFYLTFKPDLNLPDTSSSTIQQIYDLSVADPNLLKVTALDAPNGDITIRLGPEKTSLFQSGRKYNWDLQRVIEITETVDAVETVIGHDAFTYAQGQATIVVDSTITFAANAVGTVL